MQNPVSTKKGIVGYVIGAIAIAGLAFAIGYGLQKGKKTAA